MFLKKCSRCGIEKSIKEFHKRVASADGLAYNCKSCVNRNSDEWRQANPCAHKEWYLENKKRKSEYFAKWRSARPEAEAQRIAKWAKENPAKVNALIAKRRAAKQKAVPAWSDAGAIARLYEQAAELTRKTGERYEVDHIVPLQASIVCGLHCPANLQLLPKTRNISKHNRYWPDMPC